MIMRHGLNVIIEPGLRISAYPYVAIKYEADGNDGSNGYYLYDYLYRTHNHF